MKPAEVVVVSGKGGTGKTTLTSVLAKTLIGRCVLCDADVDVPDLWILASPDVRVEEEFYGGDRAALNRPRCDDCGLCVSVCRFGALSGENGKVAVDPGRCEGCGACALACPKGAVSLSPAVQGRIYGSEAETGPFWHARLVPGGENSGRLVQILRERAQKTAREREKPWILVDGPPGIACPAISAMTGCSAALAVTEPSKSGLHDLKRLGELAARFRVPMAVVLNRCDLSEEGSRAIRGVCREKGWPLLAEIPFMAGVVEDLARARIPSGNLGKAAAKVLEGLKVLLAR
jgi:MinD superfamily P-loop ATPase